MPRSLTFLTKDFAFRPAGTRMVETDGDLDPALTMVSSDFPVLLLTLASHASVAADMSRCLFHLFSIPSLCIDSSWTSRAYMRENAGVAGTWFVAANRFISTRSK